MFNYGQTVAGLGLTRAVPKENVVNKSEVKNVEDMVSCGFVVLQDGSIVNEISTNLFTAITSLYGDDARAFNKTFFETFNRTITTSDEERMLHQAMHYLSTYGAESMEIKIPAYIPVRIEDVETPERNGEFCLITIEMVSEKELISRIVEAFCNIQTVTPKFTAYFTDLAPLITSELADRIDDVKSFQVKCFLVDKLEVLPRQPQEVLRYLVFKLTGSAMLIKDKATIEGIKMGFHHPTLQKKVKDILLSVPVKKMATIFFRYKPLFLAIKTGSPDRTTKSRINQIRRAADKYHIPQDEVCIQNILNLQDYSAAADLLKKASNRELVKIVNKGIQKQIGGITEVFNIRNGKAWVKENVDEPKGYEETFDSKARYKRYIILTALETLVRNLHKSIKGKTFYIPEIFDYAVPTSERQMIGSIPFGTCVTCPDKSFVAGIHWEDNSAKDNRYELQERIDIDLHLNDNTGNHYGWNDGWYNQGRNNPSVIYSGDMTSAPRPDGATEAFYFNPNAEENKDRKFILSMHLFNSIPSIDMMPKFFMTADDADEKTFKGNAVYNPNTLLFTPLTIPVDNRGLSLGIFDGNSFYFYGGSLSESSIPNNRYSSFIEGIADRCKYRLSLKDLLQACGATVLTTESAAKEYAAAKAENDEPSDLIHLTPEELKFDTLLNIIDGVDINNN